MVHKNLKAMFSDKHIWSEKICLFDIEKTHLDDEGSSINFSAEYSIEGLSYDIVKKVLQNVAKIFQCICKTQNRDF